MVNYRIVKQLIRLTTAAAIRGRLRVCACECLCVCVCERETALQSDSGASVRAASVCRAPVCVRGSAR